MKKVCSAPFYYSAYTSSFDQESLFYTSAGLDSPLSKCIPQEPQFIVMMYSIPHLLLQFDSAIKLTTTDQ